MTETPTPAAEPPQILPRSDGGTIAYHALAGKSPGVVFLPGFNSDMTGSKALWLEAFCRVRGQAFLRFDYTGHGASSGEFTDGCIGDWAADAVAAIDELTEGPQILVGSSMGGWIMLLAALQRPQRVAALVGIAAAPDFTSERLPEELSDEQKAVLARDGVVQVLSEYDDKPTPITQKLIDEGNEHLLLKDRIPITVPVRLVHGTADKDVPWDTSLRLAAALDSTDVEITFIKHGGHRMSEPQDLKRLAWTVGALIDSLSGQN